MYGRNKNQKRRTDFDKHSVFGNYNGKSIDYTRKSKYYEKINGNYFEGDFNIKPILGTDLDFNKIQNMLLGRAIDDLNKGKYTESLCRSNV